MYKNPEFWFRFFLICSAMVLAGNLLAQAPQAQGTQAPLSFDALPRAKRADSVRTAPAARRGASVKPQLRVDTVRVVQLRVDTVVVTRPAAPAPEASATPKATQVPSAPVAPAAPAAPAFSPPVVSGLLQVQISGGDASLRSTYRVRRAEVKVVSDIGRRAQATLMIDVAKALSISTTGTQPAVTQSSRILQDAILSLPIGRVQLDAGQQRLPLGYEGSFSSSTLETVDRALMESDRARGGSFGDVRDLGVAARGKWRWLEYRAGVFNGSGETMNEVDKNAGKALVGQLGLRPSFVKGLRLGASGATSGQAAADKPIRDRYGVDVVYLRGRVLVQTEAMQGRDGTITREGMYAMAGFNVLKTVKLLTRFDAWDPDIRKEGLAADVTERDYLAGITWLPSKTRLKAQLAVVHKTYSSAITPSITQLLTQVQASW